VHVSDVLISKCNKSSSQKFVNDMMTAMYSDEYMASHSLGGISSKESQKAALPAADIQKITGMFYRVFYRLVQCMLL